MNAKKQRLAIRYALSSVGMLLVGCAGPMERDAETAMREQMLQSHRALVQSVAAGPVIELSRPSSEVDNELSPERREELDRLSGIASYQSQTLAPGSTLLGQAQDAGDAVKLSLQQTVELAVKHNIELQQARLIPAIGQTQVTQAEAAFDAVFFTTGNLNRQDEPRAGGLFASPFQVTDTDSLTTGIRKPLTTGGQVIVQTNLTRTNNNPVLVAGAPAEFYTTSIELGISQPLLRGFGSDVNRSQIILAESGRQQNAYDLKRTLLELASATEQSYWNLYFARQRLLIQQRLLERTMDDYQRIKQRETFDVNPVRKTEAGSFVELRRADVIRARQEVRSASDNLKRLIGSPDLPLSGETLLEPLDVPADAPVQFSLVDAVTTAMQHRPELQKALLQIKDASVRLRVADNSRLPLLNLEASMRYQGLGLSEGRAYSNMNDADFITYLLGMRFEVPIGNRGPEALLEQRGLERRAFALAYQQQTQDVVLEVKNAMRRLLTAYELIGAAKAARRAAADNLRALERQEEAGVALTPEFLLDLKLRSQERLANAETQEIQALADYNAAVANFFRTTGTLLDRNGIVFEMPASRQ